MIGQGEEFYGDGGGEESCFDVSVGCWSVVKLVELFFFYWQIVDLDVKSDNCVRYILIEVVVVEEGRRKVRDLGVKCWRNDDGRMCYVELKLGLFRYCCVWDYFFYFKFQGINLFNEGCFVVVWIGRGQWDLNF